MKEITLKGDIIQEGSFEGEIHYLRSFKDLENITAKSLIVLDGCAKSTAILGMQKANSIIKVGASETSHLVLCIDSQTSFASISNKTKEDLIQGEYVSISFESSQKDSIVTKYSIPKKKSLDLIQNFSGQKGARLDKLSQFGLKVPNYKILDFEFLEKNLKKTNANKLFNEYLSLIKNLTSQTEMFSYAKEYSEKIKEDIKSNLEMILKKELETNISSLKFPISVRSNFNLEDQSKESMAGVFQSDLNVIGEQLASSVCDVLASMYNLETLTKYKDMMPQIRPSIILQEMVKDPLFSGTIFLHSKTNPNVAIVEAKLYDYGDALMSGNADPDIKLVVAHDLSEIQIKEFNMPEELKANCLDSIINILRDSFELYRLTGWDDIEFSVNKQFEDYWLQARSIKEFVVGIKKQEYHSFNLSEYFFNTIHYRNTESNQIKNTKFGYEFKEDMITVNESLELGNPVKVFRDFPEVEFLFHNKIKSELQHIKDITAFGYKVDEEMNLVLNKQQDINLSEYYNLLTLHAAIRHGSFGFRSRFKPHYNQRFWIGQREKWLSELVGKVIEKSGLDLKTSEAIDSMYITDFDNSSIIEQEKIIKIIEKCSSKKEIENEELMDATLCQLHEIPDYLNPDSKNKYELFLNDAKSGIQSTNVDDAMAVLKQLKEIKLQRTQTRDEVYQAGNKFLDSKEKDLFNAMYDYMQMKGKTNETHPYFRGKIFLKISDYFSKKGISLTKTNFEELKSININPDDLKLLDMKPIY